MSFSRDGLVLGKGTVLVPAVGDDDSAVLIDGHEDRLWALLSAAYGRAPPFGAVDHVRRAAKYWNDGDSDRAELHLSLAGLPKLDPSGADAKRLFLADGLMRSGIGPEDICKALDVEAPIGELAKKSFDPGELRNPKGDGVESGRWTAAPDAGGQVKTFLERLTSSQALRLALYAARVAGPWAALGTVFITTNKSLRVEGDVPGYPGMTYLWHSDATRLYLNYNDPDGGSKSVVAQLDGKLFRDSNGRVVGRLLPKDTLAIDPAAAFNLKHRDEPERCPRPGADKPGKRSEASLDYEDYIKRILNPRDPTPRRFGVQLPSLIAPDGKTYYDDCQRTTGMLAEMKWGYTDFIRQQLHYGFGDLGADWVKQATNQLNSSQGRPITWFFSERIPAIAASILFKSKSEGLERIRIVYAPYKAAQK